MVIVSFLASAALQIGVPVRMECSFVGDDPSARDIVGERPIAFTIAARGTRINSVAVDDPTGIFSSGNIVGFVSAGRDGGRYAEAPREEEPRWRGRMDQERLLLSGVRREVSLRADAGNPDAWIGRLRYELGGAGSFRFVKDGTLSCRRSSRAVEGNAE